jgi:small subunit ribosomal protein S21
MTPEKDLCNRPRSCYSPRLFGNRSRRKPGRLPPDLQKTNDSPHSDNGGSCDQTGDYGAVQVLVRDNNVDQALKALKKKMQREGVFREMKLRRHYEKPSERKAREAAEAVRRARKMERKRLEREGF